MVRSVQSDTEYSKSVTYSRKSTDPEDYQNVPRAVGAMPKSYPAGYAGFVHQHVRAQLLFAESGVMKFTAEEHSWIIPPQRAVWIPAGHPHQTGTVNAVEMRTLYVRKDSYPLHFPAKPHLVQVSPLLRELILRTTEMPIEYEENGRDGRIVNLIFDEIEWSAARPARRPMLQDPRLLRIEGKFAENPGDRRTLQDLAMEERVSCRTLARLFQHETGASFRTWRHQVRALAALPRLAAGEPIIEIALDLGYESPGAFTAMFRKIMGATPSQYFATKTKNV